MLPVTQASSAQAPVTVTIELHVVWMLLGFPDVPEHPAQSFAATRLRSMLLLSVTVEHHDLTLLLDMHHAAPPRMVADWSGIIGQPPCLGIDWLPSDAVHEPLSLCLSICRARAACQPMLECGGFSAATLRADLHD
mmetsp:Transcript_67919/g.219825  ORF Transcript_67919/g.219825 Transcript_67919/m.219825 type:complete len:136 (+) Transcript_67919:215-622(+)